MEKLQYLIELYQYRAQYVEIKCYQTEYVHLVNRKSVFLSEELEPVVSYLKTETSFCTIKLWQLK
jgi:hypothetical protein